MHSMVERGKMEKQEEKRVCILVASSGGEGYSASDPVYEQNDVLGSTVALLVKSCCSRFSWLLGSYQKR